MAKVRHDARWLTEAEKKDIGMLENAQPMKCSNVLKLADDEEGLFNYLCNFCCGSPLLFIYLFILVANIPVVHQAKWLH